MKKNTVLTAIVVMITFFLTFQSSMLADEVSHTIRSDPFTGSCSEFLDHIDSTGVTDPEGNEKPGGLGVTNFTSIKHKSTIQKSAASVDIFRNKGDRFFCPCNDTYYQDIGKCIAECRTSLGCFTN